MRIIDRVEFLKLPENTVYSPFKPHYFGGLSIKGETINNNNYFTQTLSDSFSFADHDERID